MEDLSEALGTSIAELLTGDLRENENRSGNMKKVHFYVCPICGNIIMSVGQGSFSCCGITLPEQEAEAGEEEHEIHLETVDHEYHITMEHSMDKKHYVSFVAYITSDSAEVVRLYPEQDMNPILENLSPERSIIKGSAVPYLTNQIWRYSLSFSIQDSVNIQFRRLIQSFRNIFAVLFALAYTLGKKIFNLSVDRAEVVLCPGCDLVIKFGRKPERNLFFLAVAHLNKDFRNLLRAERRDCRKERPEGWKPLPLFSLRQGLSFRVL